jgi:hypothetical protein
MVEKSGTSQSAQNFFKPPIEAEPLYPETADTFTKQRLHFGDPNI